MRTLWRAVLPAAAALAALAAPSAAHAALDFHPCGQPRGVQCARLDVPIDRSGAVPGSVSLLVQRVPAPHPAGSTALVGLSGGPGQTSGNFTLDFAQLLAPALRTRDLIVFDQRGTGSSGALHCAGIESGAPASEAVPACASALGEAAHHYTTPDSADDLEAIRQALGVDKLDIFGGSYGTWLAQVYARRYPQHVDALVLDSTVSPLRIDDGLDVNYFRELPQAIRAICAAHACRGLTSDLWADGVRLYERLGRRPLHATYFDGVGHRRAAVIDQVSLALLVPDFDLHADRRAELPRAIHGALHGDPSLLARLIALSGARPDPKRDENPTLFDATECEEVGMPFDRTASPQDKLAQAQAALSRVPASVFAPFGAELAFGVSLVPTCAYWPALPSRPSFGGPLPDVRALLLHGDTDARTTPAETAQVAAGLPRSVVVRVPDAAHATWATDPSGCVRRAINAFLAGSTPASCRRPRSDPYAPRPLPPSSLAAVRRTAGVPGLTGRALAAVAATVDDAFEQLDYAALRRRSVERSAAFGGLRGGSLHGGRRGPTLRAYSYVRGLTVTGLVPRSGTAVVTVGGRVRGRLRFRADGTVTGRLGGQAVRARLRIARETPYEVLRARGLLPG